MRVAREYRTASRANYDRFCDKHPEIDISYKKYVEVIKVCNSMYYEYCLNTGDKIRLPFGFGEIAVHKYKTKTFKVDKEGNKKVALPVDYKKSKEEGVIVYNMNFHSSGYRFKWRLFLKTVRLSQPGVWVFKPSRLISRTLAKYIFSDAKYSQLYKTW